MLTKKNACWAKNPGTIIIIAARNNKKMVFLWRRWENNEKGYFTAQNTKSGAKNDETWTIETLTKWQKSIKSNQTEYINRSESDTENLQKFRSYVVGPKQS